MEVMIKLLVKLIKGRLTDGFIWKALSNNWFYAVKGAFQSIMIRAELVICSRYNHDLSILDRFLS